MISRFPKGLDSLVMKGCRNVDSDALMEVAVWVCGKEGKTIDEPESWVARKRRRNDVERKNTLMISDAKLTWPKETEGRGTSSPIKMKRLDFSETAVDGSVLEIFRSHQYPILDLGLGSCSNISGHDWRRLFSAFKVSSGIHKLDVSGNWDIDPSTFLPMLAKDKARCLPTLRELDLRDCEQLTREDISMVSAGLSKDCVIRENAVLADTSVEEIRRYIERIAYAPIAV